jgi:starch phosphorylase
MKVLVNGGINLSELDGWWAEAYAPELGWALGDGLEHGDDPSTNAAEADALYRLLEREVIPQFYARDQNDIPVAWVSRMRESMAQLTPQFSSNRVVREYTEKRYIPAATAYNKRAADKGAIGRKVVDWRHAVDKHWDSVLFGKLRVETTADKHSFEVEISLGALDFHTVRVELYADGINNGAQECLEMNCTQPPPDAGGQCVYGITFASKRPAADYTARVIPQLSGVAVPLELNRILWQK